MAISLKHNKTSTLPNGTDTSLIQPSDWNAEHTLTLASSRLLGRTTAGTGAAEEISVGSGLSFASGSLSLASHTHAISDVTGLQTALDGKQAAGSYAAASHTHAIADVTGLQTALDGKQAAGSYAAASHTHTIANVTGLQTALDAKAPLTGAGTSGTWGISITGNAATATTSSQLGGISSNRAILKRRSRIHSTDGTSLNSSITAPEMGFTYGGSGEPTGPYITFGGLGGDIDYSCQFVGSYNGGGNDFKIRTRNDDSAAWNPWRTLLTDGNYSSYALPLSGGTMTGTITNSANSLVIGTAGGATRGYLYNDTGGFGLLTNSGGWAIMVPVGTANATVTGVLTAGSDARAPIFYDSNDTAWYVNPNGTSRINQTYHNTGTWNYSVEGWQRYHFTSSGPTYLQGGTTAQWYIQFGTSNDGATRSILEGGGNFYTNGNVVAYWSDRRLKSHFQRIDNWREIISGLNGYYYEWNELGKKVLDGVADDGVQVGLVAQEVKAVLPQAAAIQMMQYKQKTSDGVLIPKDDINYDPENPYLTVREEKLIPVLVEAIKGLMAEVDTLKANMEKY